MVEPNCPETVFRKSGTIGADFHSGRTGFSPMTDLARLKDNRFVVLGRAGMDIYADPPGAKLDTVTRFVACLGGSSANIAVAISRHGGNASLVTSVSDDAIGRFCLNELDRYGVSRAHVKQVPGPLRTSLAIAESTFEGHQCVLYRNGAADFQMTVQDVEQIDYGSFGGLITTGTVFAEEPSRSAAFRALELAANAGLPLIVDIDYRPHSWCSTEDATETLSRAGSLCDIVIGNDTEFDFMAGGADQGLEKARTLARSTAAIAVYKMGENGSVTITGDNEFRTGVFDVPALKPIGAGDGFMGGFLVGLAAGFPLEAAVVRGAACAAIVVSRVGCAPAMPDAKELEEFLAEHPMPRTSYADELQDYPGPTAT